MTDTNTQEPLGDEGADTALSPSEDKAEFDAAWADLAKKDREASSEEEDLTDPLNEPKPKEDEPAGQAAEPPANDEPAEKPGSEEKPDIWANATPEQREAFQAERTNREKAEAQINTQNGRLSKAQTDLRTLQDALASERTEAAKAKDAEAAEGREERRKQLREEYPDVAGPLLDELQSQEDRVKQLTESVESLRTSTIQQPFGPDPYDALIEKHPDWQEFGDGGARNKDFVTWVLAQPPHVIAAVEANGKTIVDSASISAILSDFKATLEPDAGEQTEAQKLAERRERQRNATVAPAPKGQPPAAAGADNDFDAEWKRLAEIDRRRTATR